MIDLLVKEPFMRHRALIVALAALAILLPSAGFAQDITGPGSASVILYRSTSVTNASGSVGTAQTLFSKTISDAILATTPGKLQLKGYLASANSSPGTMAITCAYAGISVTPTGSSPPTLTANLLNVPISITVRITPLASGRTQKAIYADVSAIQSSTTASSWSARATGTETAGVNTQTLSCTVTFSNATTATGIIIEEAVLETGA